MALTSSNLEANREIVEDGITYYVLTSRNGTTTWYKDSNRKIRHRLLGPAYIVPRVGCSWHVEDQHHRDDGPAVEYDNGDKLFYIHGKPVDRAVYESWRDEKASIPLEFTF